MPSKRQLKKQESEEEDFKTAILEQCKVLGIDPDKYPDIFAKESLLARTKWEEQEDNEILSIYK